MANYAYLDENNKVIDCITGRDEDDLEALPENFSSWEKYYGSQRNLKCLRYSWNTEAGQHKTGGVPFRKNFAEFGGSYDAELDAFIPPKLFDSWVLDTNTCTWIAPVNHPNDEQNYYWDETTVNWKLIETEA